MELTQQQRRFIADQLSNADMVGDQELREHFIAEGIPADVADQAMKDRSFWENNIVMSEEWFAGQRPEVYKP